MWLVERCLGAEDGSGCSGSKREGVGLAPHPMQGKLQFMDHRQGRTMQLVGPQGSQGSIADRTVSPLTDTDTYARHTQTQWREGKMAFATTVSTGPALVKRRRGQDQRLKE